MDRESVAAIMDYFDINLWGIFAMPVGLILCFGPALVVWLVQELGGNRQDRTRDRK